MKKSLKVIASSALLLIIFSGFALAAGIDTPQWFKDMINFKKEQVEQAVKDGRLTPDQAKAWNEHFDYMEKWHKENGFGPGTCAGGFGGFGPNGQNFKGSFGPGMMGGFYSSQNQ
ncbi:DUF2680 domain-containing protein [Fonticella tunisiensis]|uniref:Uncharacterized protein DUF2680 n=1 Tax=Fonticella tunisiensis TaxID=1096341 RepID=A0A4R7KSQ6_9CLOT|nr:DUF2680 domain-containing protein [Fonticella tunisiensis]TDT58459.1 uncharacterized protein DUF2680 [Fonticella tunisiensis]